MPERTTKLLLLIPEQAISNALLLLMKVSKGLFLTIWSLINLKKDLKGLNQWHSIQLELPKILVTTQSICFSLKIKSSHVF
jgi:hypothetical protein